MTMTKAVMTAMAFSLTFMGLLTVSGARSFVTCS